MGTVNIIVLAILAIIPLGVIWALNTLFTLHIEYSLETWAAVFILVIVLSSRNTIRS